MIKDGGGNLFVADAGEEADLSDLGAIATEVVWNDNDHVRKLKAWMDCTSNMRPFDRNLDNHS